MADIIAKWREKPAGALIWIISRMILAFSIPHVPIGRAWIAHYLSNICPKFKTLAKVASSVVLERNSRLLVFNAYPTTQYLAEQFLKVLGFRVKVLRAGMTADRISSVAAEFNDKNASVDVLVITYATCSFGLNLHRICHDLVMAEPALNANTALQTIGQVHRLGQTTPQRVWILSSPHTFDAFVEANQARKMVIQIAAGDEPHEEIGNGTNTGRGSGEEVPTELGRRCEDLFCQLFGVQKSRLSHRDPADLDLGRDQLKSIHATIPFILIQSANTPRTQPSKRKRATVSSPPARKRLSITPQE